MPHFVSAVHFDQNSPIYYFIISDAIGRSIVIFLLLMSVLVWAIMLDKLTEIKAALKAARHFRANVQDASSYLMQSGRGDAEASPLSSILEAGTDQLCRILRCDRATLMQYARENLLLRPLTKSEEEMVRKAVELAASDLQEHYEERMNLLTTAISTAPLFGLFGTVYGVMFSFGAMAEGGSAQISAIAPGIASALLTTVAGLTVAIPATIGNNYLRGLIGRLNSEMDGFSHDFMANLGLHRVRKPSNV